MSTSVGIQMAVNQQGHASYEQYLVTAAGRITCLRCTAKSTRTKHQCGRPAIKTSRTQKCQYHGGRAHSKDVLRRISDANVLHGQATKEAKQEYKQDAIFIRQLEDAMHVLKMGEGSRIRGRKPAGYKPVHTTADVVRMIQERGLHKV